MAREAEMEDLARARPASPRRRATPSTRSEAGHQPPPRARSASRTPAPPVHEAGAGPEDEVAANGRPKPSASADDAREAGHRRVLARAAPGTIMVEPRQSSVRDAARRPCGLHPRPQVLDRAEARGRWRRACRARRPRRPPRRREGRGRGAPSSIAPPAGSSQATSTLRMRGAGAARRPRRGASRRSARGVRGGDGAGRGVGRDVMRSPVHRRRPARTGGREDRLGRATMARGAHGQRCRAAPTDATAEAVAADASRRGGRAGTGTVKRSVVAARPDRRAMRRRVQPRAQGGRGRLSAAAMRSISAAVGTWRSRWSLRRRRRGHHGGEG